MTIERIQPPAGPSPQWQADEFKPVEPKETAKSAPAAPAPQTHMHTQKDMTAAVNRTDAAAGKRKSRTPSAQVATATQEITADKIRAMQVRSQTEMKITALDQSLYITRQELVKAAHEQLLAESDGQAAGNEVSYWDKLDVVEKARTINQLKDRLQGMELQRGDLVAQAAKQVQANSYRVTGAEILTGILEEHV